MWDLCGIYGGFMGDLCGMFFCTSVVVLSWSQSAVFLALIVERTGYCLEKWKREKVPSELEANDLLLPLTFSYWVQIPTEASRAEEGIDVYLLCIPFKIGLTQSANYLNDFLLVHFSLLACPLFFAPTNKIPARWSAGFRVIPPYAHDEICAGLKWTEFHCVITDCFFFYYYFFIKSWCNLLFLLVKNPDF